MRRSDWFTRSADALGRRPWLAPLVLLGLNLGYFAWSQDAVSGLGIGNVSAQQRSDADPLEQGIRLLSVQEGLQVQLKAQLARAQAEAAALANEPEKVGDTVQESEIVLEYEPPSKPSAATRPASKNKAPQPIVELRVKNPRY